MDDSNEVVVRPDTVRMKLEVLPVRVLMRSYFSTYMLWAARDFGSKAAAIETAHNGESRFELEHRAYVLGAVTSAAAFLEAMINELFQDAYENHGIKDDGYIAPLSQRTHQLMAGWWAASGEGFEPVLEKYRYCFCSPINRDSIRVRSRIRAHTC